ncbi:HAD family hydrolase [Actinoplanes flavus]|uniref:HAD family hydrolase n=1 Tax=Actinoplanes flavus TaxID=2820290 RepID=A0ABS3UJ20_9ACTN|nr:HAD hydrolase-like protein [Actinoplanes flavus]MBO3738779.1 HAD family hydrolase [Actinoplanes flavus]
MIRAVIIDVDDTLCMTEAASFVLENEVLAAMGRPPMTRELHLATWGDPLLEAMPKRSPGIDLNIFGPLFQTAMERHVADGLLDVIPEENLNALDALIEADRSVLLLTSRAESEIRHMLEPGHAVASRVSGAYHRGNTRYGKPDPRAFDELLAHTGLSPAQCVYVGDSPGDAVAAGGAGMAFIACLQSGVRRIEDFDGRHVTATIDAFPEVVPVVERLSRIPG